MESSTAVNLEIAHVLFIDIVGYTKLLTSEQRQRQQELNGIVRETEAFRVADAGGKLVRIPTGDGMVLAFFTTPDAPVRCAMAISRALHKTTHLPLRMGINSGPVDLVQDVNDKTNLAGIGVNIAQRVMDCGDAGHILLSARAADDLAEHAEWKERLHYLGEVEVKHGTRVRVASLYGDGVGNPALPQKLRRQRRLRQRRAAVGAGIALVLAAVIALAVWQTQRRGKLRAQAAAETAAKTAKSVAVLPFENLNPDDRDGIFAGGVHREVLLDLAKIADLKVISRSSVMRYKPGADRNLQQIAKELGVAYVVEGTVQREPDHVRVSVELIDARTDTHAWAETYDGKVADVLSFQSDIAQRISNQVGAKLSPRESTELASRATRDIAAFEDYIRARALMEAAEDNDAERDQFVENQHQAVRLLEQAVARDPNFLLAYCALSEANIQLFRSANPLPDPAYRDRAAAALKNAQRIAPDAGETIYAQSRLVYYGQRDFSGALALLERAAKLLPNSADITMTRALLYRRFGRWQEAYAQFLRTQELNPQEPSAYYSAAGAAIALRWWDEADRVRARFVATFPRFKRPARLEEAVSLRLRGEVEAGNRLLKEANLNVENGFTALFYISLWKHDYDECHRLIAEAAKYPEVETDRWQKEARLAYITKTPGSQQAAAAAETDVAARLQRTPDSDFDEELTNTLISIKLILGKKEEAVHLAEESVQKHPVSEDVLSNTDRLQWLAYTYLFAGDNERAIQTLAELVQIPDGINYGPLKYDPAFDELRKDPRFDSLLKQAQQPFPRL